MKKALSVLKNILVWTVVAIAVAMMIFTIVSVSTFDRNDRDIFGYKAFIVLSDSMSATDFDAGDVVLVRECDPATLKEGDIIAYQSEHPDNYGETVTHKIRRKTVDVNGNPGFITYGTTTNTDDELVVTYSFVLGKYQGRLPMVGKFFQFLKTTPGYIICIFIPFLILIIMQGAHSISLFRKYKNEQLAEMKAEKEALEEERRKSEEMYKELMELKAKLAGETKTENEEELPTEKEK